MQFNNISSCNECVNVSQLLKDYEKNNLKAVEDLFNDPDKFIKYAWKPHGTLLFDNECRCKMGEGEIKSPFSCYNCKNLKRIVDFKIESIYQPFQIECGDNTGVSLILIKNDIMKPKLFWDLSSSEKARNYLKRYSYLQACGAPLDISRMKCLRGDPFTIRILNDWIVEKYLKDKGLNNTLKNYTSYICGQHGYSLFEYPNIGNFKKFIQNKDYKLNSHLNPIFTKSIINQMIIVLKTLREINFNHGSPSFKSLFFSKKKFKYEEDGINIESKFTLLFSNFLYSSLMVNDVHISSKTLESDIYLQKSNFTPDISFKSLPSSFCTNYVPKKSDHEPFVCTNTKICPTTEETTKMCSISSSKTNFFKLTNDTIDVFTNMRHIGFPLFVGCFDFYCFIVSLMCCKEFYDSVYADEELYRFWSMLWTTQDIELVENKVKFYHEETDIDNISDRVGYEIIKGLWLRCNIIDYVYHMIKNGW